MSLARARTVTLFAACLLLFGSAQAQRTSLTDLLPATTVLVLQHQPGGGDFAVLEEILGSLDLERAKTTLAALGGDLGGSLLGNGGAQNGATASGGLLDALLAEFLAACPDLEPVLPSGGVGAIGGELTLGLSISQFNPMPGLIVLLRPADAALAGDLTAGLVACAPDSATEEQSGVPLHQVFGAGAGALVLADFDGLLLAASDPDLARAVIRLARGSGELSHADGAIATAAAAIAGEGLTLTLDFASLSDSLSAFSRAAGMPSEAVALVDRLLASLRTAGGYAVNAAMKADGLHLSTLLTPNREGGDPTLARLLACLDCGSPPVPELAPAGASTVRSGHLLLGDLVSWVDDWLAAAAGLIGEELNVRDLLRDLIGLDIDISLLDWLEGGWYSAQLDVLSTDAQSWLAGPPSITVFPVNSEPAARAGLESWKTGINMLPFLLAQLDLAGLGTLPDESGGALSVRQVSYRGVAYERWRLGPTGDIGLLVTRGNLVVASPASAMRQVIDVLAGAPSFVADGAMQQARASVPASAVAYSLTDVPRHLRGLASISDLLAGPVAGALSLVRSLPSFDDAFSGDDSFFDDDAFFDDSFMDDDPFWNTGFPMRGNDYFGPSPLQAGDQAASLEVPFAIDATITDGDELSNFNYGLVFELPGLAPGSAVEIAVTSMQLDTYLYLFDLTNGMVVADDDDSPDTSRSAIAFQVEPGIRYAVVVSSWGGFDTGAIRLSATLMSASAATAPPAGGSGANVAMPPSPGDLFDEPGTAATLPSFDELLNLFDVVTGLLDGLADRSGIGVGYTWLDGGLVRSSTWIPLR